MTLKETKAGKAAKKSAAELKSLGATREMLIQVGFNAADLDLIFTTVTATYGVTTRFLVENGIKGTERSYIIPNFGLNQKENVILESVIYALSNANKVLFPNYKTVLKTEEDIVLAVADGTISKYNSVGCFKASDNKSYRMGILNDVIERTSNEYTLHCTKKADASSTVKTYDVVEILHR